MTVEESLDRLRHSNPVLTESIVDQRLFRSIVSRPVDPRFGRPAPTRNERPGRLRLAVVLVALGVGVGAAWAASGGPLELFRSNPQAEGAAPASLWDQDVRPSSVVRAALLAIPELGTVEFWYAETEQGGWCGAIRLPNEHWAAMKSSGTGGTAPGCYPTREQTNGDDPILVINGFDYYEVQLDARDEGGSFWRVYYGVLTTKEPVAAVVDRSSGRRAQVHAGKVFAIAVPDATPERTAPLPRGTFAPDFVAYGADGKVLASDHP